MNHDYTKLVSDHFDSPTMLKLKRTSENVLSTSLDTDAKTWQDKLEEIAQEFRLSCRFCLMRIFQERAKHQNQSTPEGFWVEVDGERYEFSDITIEHVEFMSEEESETYCAYMRNLARKYPCPENWKDLNLPELVENNCTPEEYEGNLIKKAWAHRLPDKDKLVLTRGEAFRLGHMLAFDRAEMEFFLMRVFDYEEGFRFDTSNDLIEAYGLKTQKHWLDVEKLKQDYQEKTVGIQKKEREDRNYDWTKKNDTSVVNGFDSEEEFLKWLESRASGLDTGSRTARRIYRNLAAECLRLSKEDKKRKPDLETCVHCILKEKTETELARGWIFDNDKPSEEKCKSFAWRLYKINWEQAQGYEQSRQKSWRVPTLTDRESKFSTSCGPINLSKRVEELLCGRVQVEKSDIIFMLWVIANQIWSKTAMDSRDISLRLQDFIDNCNKCLKEAMLPPFYVPHLLERTMLLAIVCNGTETYSFQPAKEYEKILNLEKNIKLKEAEDAGKSGIREKKTGYHRHSEPEWRKLVKLSREMLEYTMEEFAEWAGVSVPSLNQHQNLFVQEGELEPFDRKKEWKEKKLQLEQEGKLDAVMENKKKALAASPEDRQKALTEALDNIQEEEYSCKEEKCEQDRKEK